MRSMWLRVPALLMVALVVVVASPQQRAHALLRTGAPLVPRAITAGGTLISGGTTVGGIAATSAATISAPVVIAGALTIGALYVGYRHFSGDPIEWWWADGAADPGVEPSEAMITSTGSVIETSRYIAGSMSSSQKIAIELIEEISVTEGQVLFEWTCANGDTGVIGLTGGGTMSRPVGYTQTIETGSTGCFPDTSHEEFLAGQTTWRVYHDMSPGNLAEMTLEPGGVPAFGGDPTATGTLTTTLQCNNGSSIIPRTFESLPYKADEPAPAIPDGSCLEGEKIEDVQVTRAAPGVDPVNFIGGFETATGSPTVPQDFLDEFDAECQRLLSDAMSSLPFDNITDCVAFLTNNYDECVELLAGAAVIPDEDDLCGMVLYPRPFEHEFPRIVTLPCTYDICFDWWNEERPEEKYGCVWENMVTGAYVPLPISECEGLQWQRDVDGNTRTKSPYQEAELPLPGSSPIPNAGCMTRDPDQDGLMTFFIFRGMSCALQWAFVPSEATMTRVTQFGDHAGGKAPVSLVTGASSWFSAFGDLPDDCLELSVPVEGYGSYGIVDACGSHEVTDELTSYRPLLSVAVWGMFLSPLAWWAWRQYAPGSQGEA